MSGYLCNRMSPIEMFSIMTEGDAKAARSLLQMATNPNVSLSDILALDSMEIYGNKLSIFWRKYCKKNGTLMKKTIEAFQSGAISMEEIHKALSSKKVRPLI